MKKLFVFIGLMLLAGAYIVPVNASTDVNIVVVADDEKCEKCGKDNCDGKCTATVEGKKATTAEKTTKKCDAECEKACCADKKSEATAGKGCDVKKKESKK